MTKLCIECKHCGPLTIVDNGSDITLCQRNGVVRPGISPVTGRPYQEKITMYAEIERMANNPGRCGVDGKYFEAKQTEQTV